VLLRQYLYFCASKASKVSGKYAKSSRRPTSSTALLRQYLYFCASKASNVSTELLVHLLRSRVALVARIAKHLRIRQHLSVYVCIHHLRGRAHRETHVCDLVTTLPTEAELAQKYTYDFFYFFI
jgi:hypothetical protein